MSPSIIYLGRDVHKESITLAVLPSEAAIPTRLERLPYDLKKLRAIAGRISGPLMRSGWPTTPTGRMRR